MRSPVRAKGPQEAPHCAVEAAGQSAILPGRKPALGLGSMLSTSAGSEFESGR